MFFKKLVAVLLIIVGFVGCAPNTVAFKDNSPTPVPTNQSIPHEQVQSSPSNNSATARLHFSGQAASTWSIQKEPGMMIAHVKLNGCWYFTLAGYGPGYSKLDYPEEDLLQTIASADFGKPDDAAGWNGREIVDEYRSLDGGEEMVLPNLNTLQLKELSPDCSWTLDLLPMNAATPIRLNETLSGVYNEVIILDGKTNTLWITDYNPPRAYVSLTFYDAEGQLWIPPDETSDMIKGIPVDVKYVQLRAGGSWTISANNTEN